MDRYKTLDFEKLVSIQKPLLDGGIRSVNFFNGRLLSGEDLSAEQQANRVAHQRLGMAIGQGIVTGLDVTMPSPASTHTDTPSSSVVTVKRGMAMNALGQTLLLASDINVSLTDPSNCSAPTSSATYAGTFHNAQTSPVGACFAPSSPHHAPVQESIYLLTIAPATANEGFSPVGSGFAPVQIGTITTSTTSYRVDAVQFRLFPLLLGSNILSNPKHVRNRIAYACFGFTNQGPRQQYSLPDDFGPFVHPEKLLDTLSLDLTEDIPLAILYWTGSTQDRFIDTWSVRRRLIAPAFTQCWQEVIGDRRLAEAEAMFLQFQSHITDIQHGTGGTYSAAQTPLSMLQAEQLFSYLPAAGYLPVGKDAFDWQTFLGPLAPPDAICVDKALLRLLLQNSFYETPIKVGPYADGSPADEQPVNVYQDSSQPDFILFSRSTSGRMSITVNAQGYQSTEVSVSVGIGQQTQLTLPLQQDSSEVTKRLPYIDVENLSRPGLHKVRFSIVQQPGKLPPSLHSTMIKVDPLPENVLNWLKVWQQWFNDRYPNQGIDCSPPALYMNDQYRPPVRHYAPEEPSAYAVFGEVVVPLLVNVSFYTMPLAVSLTEVSLPGLTNDVVQALANIGIVSIEQVAGAWSRLIADATQRSTVYGEYLILDAVHAIERIIPMRLYYNGIEEVVGETPIEEILEQMALADDVALANADTVRLGESLKSVGFASRLIAQAQKAVPPEHWSLASLGLSLEQIPLLRHIRINSKGEFAQHAETEEGRWLLGSVLQLDVRTIEQLQEKAFGQMAASSFALARIKDLILLPNANAQVTTKLAASHIFTADQLARLKKEELMKLTGLHEDAAEDLQEAAEDASKEGQEVVRLAPITRDVAHALNEVLHVRTIADLSEKSHEEVAEVFKSEKFHFARRALQFVNALFDGIAGAGR